MLYTTPFGERRIRVLNQALPVAKNLNMYYKSAEVETTAQFMVKRELSKVCIKGVKNTKEKLLNNLVTLLY